MKKSFKQGLVIGGIAVLTALVVKRYQQGGFSSQDFSDPTALDRQPSIDAKKDEAEVGLTQLDSIHRADWQANGFPQTHAELERLEKEEGY